MQGWIIGGLLRQRLDDGGGEVLGRRDRSGRGRWIDRGRVHGTRRWLKLRTVELFGLKAKLGGTKIDAWQEEQPGYLRCGDKGSNGMVVAASQ